MYQGSLDTTRMGSIISVLEKIQQGSRDPLHSSEHRMKFPIDQGYDKIHRGTINGFRDHIIHIE